MAQRERYRPSGFFRPTTIVFFAGAVVAGAALAWPYQRLLDWIPFIYINLIIVLGFAFALAAGVFFAVKKGHCRNRVLAVLLALPVGAAGVAASHWFGYQHALSKTLEQMHEVGRTMEDAEQAIPFSRYLELRVEAGWQLDDSGSSSSKSPVDGFVVWLVWGIEALVLLGAAVAGAVQATSEPYCERCNRWCDHRAYKLPGLLQADVEGVLAGDDLGALADLRPPADPIREFAVQVDLHTCGGCRESGFLTLSEKRIVAKGKKAEEKKRRIATRLVLRAPEREKLERVALGVVGQKLPAA